MIEKFTSWALDLRLNCFLSVDPLAQWPPLPPSLSVPSSCKWRMVAPLSLGLSWALWAQFTVRFVCCPQRRQYCLTYFRADTYVGKCKPDRSTAQQSGNPSVKTFVLCLALPCRFHYLFKFVEANLHIEFENREMRHEESWQMAK